MTNEALFSPPPPAPREFRGVWVATVDNIDWPTKRDLTTDAQKRELLHILDTCRRLNLNAVILQVRPSCDSLYESSIEPWSEYLTGKQGNAPNPKWDPLAFAIDEAHKRGLELHAWFNPYRAKHPAAKGPLASNHIANTHPNLVRTYGTYLWLDPGEPAVQQRSLDVFLDVVKRYDVDGIHIDDYFYPYPVKDEKGAEVPFPDEKSYAAYRAGGGRLALKDWRRKSVDDFVQRVYEGTKKLKPWVKFGISPFGIYRPGVPPTIKAGIDQYDQLYADCLKWLRMGWCDYFTPQLYWPITQTPQSYPVLLDWWVSQNVKKRHIWPGNFTSQLRGTNPAWTVEELLEQIRITRATRGAGGNVHFSMKAFTLNYKGIADAILAGPYKEKALVPESPWMGKRKPGAPSLQVLRRDDGRPVADWSATNSDGVRFWTVYLLRGGCWELESVQPGDRSQLDLGASNRAETDAVAVAAVDGFGLEGPRAIASLGN